MKQSELSSDWAAARQEADTLGRDEYLGITRRTGGETFEVAKLSGFDEEFDAEKPDRYVEVPLKTMAEETIFIVSHTVHTGIGKVITHWGRPRYVLDPGRNRTAYLAHRHGLRRARYLSAVRASRLMERLVTEALRKEVVPLRAKLEKAEELLEDMAFERGSLEQEVRHMRQELQRRGSE